MIGIDRDDPLIIAPDVGDGGLFPYFHARHVRWIGASLFPPPPVCDAPHDT
jgi:hypothetical protein